MITDQCNSDEDWHDMGISLNLKHFALRAKDSGDWDQENIRKTDFRELLDAKIDVVNFSRIKDDIQRFIPNASVLDIWSPQYFHDLSAKLNVNP